MSNQSEKYEWKNRMKKHGWKSVCVDFFLLMKMKSFSLFSHFFSLSKFFQMFVDADVYVGVCALKRGKSWIEY